MAITARQTRASIAVTDAATQLLVEGTSGTRVNGATDLRITVSNDGGGKGSTITAVRGYFDTTGSGVFKEDPSIATAFGTIAANASGFYQAQRVAFVACYFTAVCAATDNTTATIQMLATQGG